MQRVYFITGGAQGIGLGIASRLLSDGHRVVLFDLDEEAGREAVEALGENAFFVEGDVSEETSVRAGMAAALQRWERLDGLVNNAGISNGFGTHLEDLSLGEWERVLGVNLTGCFLCAKYAAPHLRTAGGAIVNIASTRALQSEPHTEAYSASKGGVLALTHAMAVSLGPAIRVNCISPGWIDVGMLRKESARSEPTLTAEDHAWHPAGRVGRAEDVASLAAYLLSDEAGFVTGQQFVVDGGMTRKMIYL
jgi:NAD(P)-dependent dehydrogenase (short-subunit alcohol dehydrogenase family)